MLLIDSKEMLNINKGLYIDEDIKNRRILTFWSRHKLWHFFPLSHILKKKVAYFDVFFNNLLIRIIIKYEFFELRKLLLLIIFKID